MHYALHCTSDVGCPQPQPIGRHDNAPNAAVPLLTRYVRTYTRAAQRLLMTSDATEMHWEQNSDIVRSRLDSIWLLVRCSSAVTNKVAVWHSGAYETEACANVQISLCTPVIWFSNSFVLFHVTNYTGTVFILAIAWPNFSDRQLTKKN